ncbi:hypothetical protein AVEN_218399-1 [Araneus ventricosus]|uniref:Uncharacterized protein n=1 Tax=Araneus ventricosus TaxID=182803 RepID=A0A4Y2X0J4_ARAVE|nr:hypothetical protein AVEN_218399-1 [Araneus ventricosus]
MRRNIINVIDTGLEMTDTLSAGKITKKISLLEALNFVMNALDEAPDVTIRNCFHHGDLSRTKQEDDPDIIEKPADLLEED